MSLNALALSPAEEQKSGLVSLRRLRLEGFFDGGGTDVAGVQESRCMGAAMRAG